MKINSLSIIFLCVFVTNAFSQGKIVLIGGGSEQQGGWSDTPYQWAVDQSTNKKVAVISYAEETQFIPDYFLSLGAIAADNIMIDSRSLANEQVMYDSLMEYDVFFFKGGDQYKYYQYYRDTKISEAITDKFTSGGVIAGTSAGMAILSGVIFTAEKGSVYPDETLADYRSNSLTLANDFTQILPGFIVDSHFTERGRVGRMFGFLAHWNFKTGEWIKGIGVDDRTALCIDQAKIGVVFGTGSVSFYSTNSITAFQDEKPVSDSINVIQLLHGHSLNLTSFEILNGPKDNLQPKEERDSGTYSVILSGSEGLETNLEFWNTFVESLEEGDTVTVVTSPSKGKLFIKKLEGQKINYVLVETISSNNLEEKRSLRDGIRRSKKILFVENDDQVLFTFLEGGKTGNLLLTHMKRNEVTSGFVGEDSRYAGKSFVTNHLSDPYNAYYGRLAFKKGLGLLRSSIIISNTYDVATTDYYENTTAAATYAMMADSLRYGIYLNRNSYLKFSSINMMNYFEGKGKHSVMILINTGTTTEFTTQPVNSSGAVRNYVGFSYMHYALLNGSMKYFAGETTATNDPRYESEDIITNTEREISKEIQFFPNPTPGKLNYYVPYKVFPATLTVTDALGRTIYTQEIRRADGQLDIPFSKDGIYFIHIASGNHYLTKSVVVGH